MPASLEPADLRRSWACIETTAPPSNRLRAQARTHNRRACNMSPLPLRGRVRPSVVDALSLAARLPGRRPGGLPARVRNAEAAVARNHLLHAQLEGWEGAILIHCPSGDLRQGTPRQCGSRSIAAPAAITMSILRTTAASRNPGPTGGALGWRTS